MMNPKTMDTMFNADNQFYNAVVKEYEDRTGEACQPFVDWSNDMQAEFIRNQDNEHDHKSFIDWVLKH